ncbi:MAG: ribonuclease H-like domain-containing protein [Deferribacteres bacterium]|nr:ribonuclease H-like domain-containing protein [Deferribacteres bacterium]
MEYSAYLDIETTGLSPLSGKLTVIGIYREDGTDSRIVQLVGDEICRSRLIAALEGTGIIYTYNGARFDLPFIRAKLDVDLAEYYRHRDLMYACRKRNLYGGLKGVERQLGIQRQLQDIDGRVAVQLWHNYSCYGDRRSLEMLLKYNKEDVLNLRVLRERLNL